MNVSISLTGGDAYSYSGTNVVNTNNSSSGKNGFATGSDGEVYYIINRWSITYKTCGSGKKIFIPSTAYSYGGKIHVRMEHFQAMGEPNNTAISTTMWINILYY